MKINKEFVLKNLMTIICGITIIALFMPFIGVDASVSVGGFSASSGEETFNGFAIISEGGFLGILMELCVALIIATAYLPQLKQYRKIACAASSVIGLICLFIVPGSMGKSISAAGGSGDVSAKVNISYKLGFWIMLICYIALIAMSVIQYLGLKGNKVFDAINQNCDQESAETSGATAEKLKSMAQNIAGSASNAVGGIKDKISSRSAQQNQEVQQAQPAQPIQQVQSVQPVQSAQSVQQAQPIQPNNNVGVGANTSAAPVVKGNPEETMKHIKELFEMKEAGILTEEEFNEKKQEFLQKI